MWIPDLKFVLLKIKIVVFGFKYCIKIDKIYTQELN